MKIFRRNKPADKPAEPAGTAPPAGAQGELALADPTPAPRRPWPLRHKRITALLALLAVGAAAALALRRFLPARAEAEYQYIRTVTLQTGSLDDSVTVTGTVASGQEASVTVDSSAQNYQVATVEVQVGDVVEAGGVIATLDTTSLEEQIETAQQTYSDELRSAQTTYDRAQDSYEVAVVEHDNRLIDLQENIDKAEEDLADAEEAVDEAQSACDAANSSYSELQSAYSTASSQISSFTAACQAAADAMNAAVSALNDANLSGDAAAIQAATDSLTAAQADYQAAQTQLASAQESCSVTSLGLYGFTAIEQALTEAEQTRTQAETALETAQTQLENAQTQLETAYDNYDTEKNSTTLTTSYQNVEDAATRLEEAGRTSEELTTLQETLEACTLTATMSGTITELNATVGSVCTGTVATIQDTDALVVEVTIPADDLPDLSTGMTCRITSDATGDTEIEGTLSQIDPVANDQGSFGAQVRVTGDAGGLLIGIQAQVEIVKNEVQGVYTVPLDAVGTAEDGSRYVLRKTGGEGTDMTFEEVTVTTGDENDYYVVISGDDLQEGDEIRASADLTQGIVTGETDEAAGAMGGMEMPTGGGGGDFGGNFGGGGFGGGGEMPAAPGGM